MDGKTYTPDMVLGAPRKGIKLSYCTDTRPVPSIVRNAQKADLFICEGMYGEPEKEQKAREYKHMTFQEAGAACQRCQSTGNVADALQSVAGAPGGIYARGTKYLSKCISRKRREVGGA